MRMRTIVVGVLLLLSTCICHRVYAVAGGAPVKIDDAPFMAQYVIHGQTWTCGASIVHEQFLVTAAGCVGDAEKMTVTVGTDNVKNGGKPYEIEKAFRHPQYLNVILPDYDLAVLKLKEKLEFGKQVNKIAMADSGSSPKPGDNLKTLGFGATGKEMSDVLNSVELPFVDLKTCAQDIKSLDVELTQQMMCAGGQEGKGTCATDGGSPLIYNNTLIGITTSAFLVYPCGQKGIPSTFAYLPSMRDFIDKVIKENA